MQASHIIASLAQRYRFAKGWAFMSEVTPSGTKRRMDAMAITLYPSHALRVLGFEVKVDRGDFLSEVRDPAKSAPLVESCTHYYLVCPRGIAEPGEVPENWGIIYASEVDGGVSLRQARRAKPHQQGREMGNDWWRCMLLRSLSRQTTPKEITAAFDDGYLRGRKSAAAEMERQMRADRGAAEKMREMDREFGGGLRFVDLARLGAVYRMMDQRGVGCAIRRMRETCDMLERVAAEGRQNIQTLTQLTEEQGGTARA